MTNKKALQKINKVGEDFGWQMGKISSNYENGYMKAIRDCKVVFLKDDKKVVTNADRIRNMSEEELAEFLCKFDACQRCSHNSDNACYTKNCDEIGITEKWLKEKVEQ